MRHRHIDKVPHDHALWRLALIGVFLLKWDGFRAIALKTGGLVHLRSRTDVDSMVPIRQSPERWLLA